MKIGKLNNDKLREIVIQRIGKPRHPWVKTGAGIGVDCAVLRAGDRDIITSSDPVTAGGDLSGSLAIHVSCNDIVAGGALPFALLAVLLVPPSAQEQDLLRAIDQMKQTAEDLKVDIIGGHTEVTDAVNRVIITTTAFGARNLTGAELPVRAREGDTLLMTKTAGIEGTYIVGEKYKTKRKSLLNEDEKKEWDDLYRQLSLIGEGEVLFSPNQKDTSEIHLLHDVTEGGVYGAAYEMAELSGLGVWIEQDMVPISSVTKKITDYFEIDPYRFISSGSLLIAVPGSGEDVINRMKKRGIRCTPIGRFTSAEAGYILSKDGETTPLLPPASDELYKV